MKNTQLLMLLILVVFFSTFTGKAHAHRVLVFAYEEEGKIITEAKFSSGRPIQNGTVNFLTEDGSTLAKGNTDSNGHFQLSLQNLDLAEVDSFNIEVTAGDGHKGSWMLTRDDLSDHTHSVSESSHAAAPSPPNTNDKPESVAPEVEQIVGKVIERELLPLKKMIVQQQEKTRLQDILGGIGYILGLAGIAAYFKSKNRR